MPVITLASALGTSAASTAVNVSENPYNTTCIVQVDYAASVTGNCVIQGRLASDMPWVDVWTFTADGAKVVDRYPDMRVSNGALAGGTQLITAVKLYY